MAYSFFFLHNTGHEIIKITEYPCQGTKQKYVAYLIHQALEG